MPIPEVPRDTPFDAGAQQGCFALLLTDLQAAEKHPGILLAHIVRLSSALYLIVLESEATTKAEISPCLLLVSYLRSSALAQRFGIRRWHQGSSPAGTLPKHQHLPAWNRSHNTVSPSVTLSKSKVMLGSPQRDLFNH